MAFTSATGGCMADLPERGYALREEEVMRTTWRLAWISVLWSGLALGGEPVREIDFEDVRVTAVAPSPMLSLVIDRVPYDPSLCRTLTSGDTLHVEARLHAAKTEGIRTKAPERGTYLMGACIYNNANGSWSPYLLELSRKDNLLYLTDVKKRWCDCVEGTATGNVSTTAFAVQDGGCESTDRCMKSRSFAFVGGRPRYSQVLEFEPDEEELRSIYEHFRKENAAVPHCPTVDEYIRSSKAERAWHADCWEIELHPDRLHPVELVEHCNAIIHQMRYCMSPLFAIEMHSKDGTVYYFNTIGASSFAERKSFQVAGIAWIVR